MYRTGFYFPEIFRERYDAVREKYGSQVDSYLAYTLVGDPLADAVVEDFHAFRRHDLMHVLAQALDEGIETIPDAPESLQRLFEENIDRVPYWVNREMMKTGTEVFLDHSEVFLASFTARVLPLGFMTSINKPFAATHRLEESGVSRLRANNRHFVESFLPGGMERFGDGFKLSVRIRMIHAHLRQLFIKRGEWDSNRLGHPLHSAHTTFAYVAFSAMLWETGKMLGMIENEKRSAGFMNVWKYMGYLMGIPADLLVDTVEEGVKIFNMGWDLDHNVDDDARRIVHTLIHAAPVVANVTDPKEREDLTEKIYSVSRGLLGDELADALHYPQHSGQLTTALLRAQVKWMHWKDILIPGAKEKHRLASMEKLFDVSYFQNIKIDYTPPKDVRFHKGDHEAN